MIFIKGYGIINQYITFSKVLDEQIQLYGYTEKAITETIRICLDKNILKEFLESRRNEVNDIMFMLFDEELQQKLHDKETKETAMEEGRVEGLITSIKNLMESLNIPIDKAMDVLKVPNDKREYYKTQVM